MTAWGDSASTVALVLRQVLSALAIQTVEPGGNTGLRFS